MKKINFGGNTTMKEKIGFNDLAWYLKVLVVYDIISLILSIYFLVAT